MVRGVTRVDQRELLGFRVVVRRLPPAALQREPFGELVRGAAAPRRILIAPNLRRHPHAPLAVEHRVVGVGGIVRRVRPEMLVAPVERRAGRRREPRRDFFFRLPRRDVESEGFVFVRIEHDQLAVTSRHGVDVSAGVHGRAILVRRDFVVHERVVVAHIPQRDDDVAFDAFGTRRGRRYVALRDAFGPAGVRLQQGLALVVEHAVHRRAADARAEPPFPRFFVRLEFWLRFEDVIDRTRLFVAELMAEVAVGLERVDVVVLRLHCRPDAVARGAGTGEGARRRRFQQRQPVIARIHLRGFLRRFGERRIQRDIGRAGGF